MFNPNTTLVQKIHLAKKFCVKIILILSKPTGDILSAY